MIRQELKRATDSAIESLRHVWRAFIGIQLLAVVLAVLYYTAPAATSAGDWVAHVKEHFGYLFAFIAGAITCVLLPLIAERVALPKEKHEQLTPFDILYRVLFFGSLGLLIDGFYHFQAFVFGTGVDAVTVVKKVAIDMALFTPFLSIPFTTSSLLFQERRYSLAAFAASFRDGSALRKDLCVTLTAWAYWVPMVTVLYCLPKNLQYPMSAVAEGAWALLVVAVARMAGGPDESAHHAGLAH